MQQFVASLLSAEYMITHSPVLGDNKNLHILHVINTHHHFLKLIAEWTFRAVGGCVISQSLTVLYVYYYYMIVTQNSSYSLKPAGYRYSLSVMFAHMLQFETQGNI